MILSPLIVFCAILALLYTMANRGGRSSKPNQSRPNTRSTDKKEALIPQGALSSQDFDSNSSPSDSTSGELTMGALLHMFNQLQSSFKALHDEFTELKGVNKLLQKTANDQHRDIIRLHQELDDLQQYGRRENVCFSNVKFDERDPTLSPMNQVITLCDGIGVEVTESDLVDVHPLPARKGMAKRIIARFKDRKLGQKVLTSRKNTKHIDPAKKKKLAADPARGFGIQPNITPARSALLSQAKTLVNQQGFNATWVDIKTGAILFKRRPGDRPAVIRSTGDLVAICSDFVPNEHFFSVCKDDLFDVFNPRDNDFSG
ncbi:hypothetical protein ACHWQZ_G015800 [Mnemiopsis leidyi]